MIKLIVTDLDGTLLADDKSLPTDFWDVEQQLNERNITLVIASGRPYHNMVSVFEKIRHRIFFISDNGSYMLFDGKELLEDTLDNNVVNEFVRLSRNIPDSYPVLCGKDMAFMEDNDENLLRQTLKYYQQYKIVDDLTTVEAPILKVSLCDLNNSESNTYPHYKHFADDYNVVLSSKVWVDITSKTASKGRAVKMLQKKLNLGYDETLVFGDYMNDLDMMHTAQYSYAMKNAYYKVAEAANFMTEVDNNSGGVTKTIKELVLKN